MTLGAASAHDIPDQRVDRTIQLTLEPGRLIVDYEISLSEFTLLLDLRRLEEGVEGTVRGEDVLERYGRLVAPLHAAGLMAGVDARDLQFDVVTIDRRSEDHLIYRFTFEADLPAEGNLRFRDTNYLESGGTSRLELNIHPDVRIRGDAPVDSAVAKPGWMLSDKEETARRAIDLEFESHSIPRRFDRSDPIADPRPAVGSEGRAVPQTVLADLIRAQSVPALILAAGLAFLLGIVHALQPGHGKLLVAAAAAGRGGSAWRALGLAAVVATAHMASVVGLAILLWSTRDHRLADFDRGLKLAAGGLLAIQGSYRMGRALSSGVTGEATSDGRPAETGWLAAVAAGILPCWDAILLLLFAEAQGRLALGLALVVAFSIGLLTVQFAVALTSGRLAGRLAPGSARMLLFTAGATLFGLGLTLVID